MRARFEKIDLHLNQPAVLSSSPRGYALNTLDLEVGRGHIRGSGTLEENRLAVQADYDKIPLELLRVADMNDLSGEISGSLGLRERVSEPEADLDLRVRELVIRQPQLERMPPANLSMHAKVRQGVARMELVLEGLADYPMKADLILPVVFVASPFTFSVPRDGKLDGRVAGDMDLARFPYALVLGEATLDGTLEVDFGLGGTAGAPQITGTGHLRKGAYEDAVNGLILNDVDMEIAADVPRIRIKQGRADDGGTGAIAMQGWIDLVPDRRFPFAAQITLDGATVVRHDQATVTTDGRIAVSGSLLQSLVAGDLNVTRAELRIPDRLPPEVTELNVIEINGPDEMPERQLSNGVPPKRNVRLEINVTSPGRVFVRGRGLDSEWEGDLKVRGTAEEPVVTGQLSVVRGRFDFLGKRFSLVRGSLVFDGAMPPEPLIDLVAEAPGKEITARLNLSGPAASPKLSLSSEPPLPSDEILTRLLFGRSVSDITPMQAVQLASAARTLTGGAETPFDILERTRKFLSIDTLQVNQAQGTNNETTVSAGKYLNDSVYLEVEKGVGPESGKSSVQVEVTPNITLETEVGENAQGGVGLNWKLNY